MTRARTTASSVPIGSITQFAGLTVPSGYLFCTGQSVNRADYPSLFSAVTETKGTFTVTIATPAVFTLTSHGMLTGSQVYLTTTGALPTGLAANTNYFVILVGANSFNLATTFANAVAGTAIATSGTQSGTHTLVHAPYGVASSTTFSLPNLTGRTPVGIDTSQTEFNTLGETGGAKEVTLTSAQSGVPLHSHPNSLTGTTTFASDGHYHIQTTNFNVGYFAGNGHQFTLGGTVVGNGTVGTYGNTGSASVGLSNANNTAANAASAHTNLQPYITINYIIRAV